MVMWLVNHLPLIKGTLGHNIHRAIAILYNIAIILSMSNEAGDTINLVHENLVGPSAYLHILWVVESPVGLRRQQSLFLIVLLLCDKTLYATITLLKLREGV